MLAVLGVLVAFDALSLPLFLTAALLGLLVLVERETPQYVTPPWVVGLRRFVAVGLVGFGLYVLYRLVLMLPEGAL